MKLHDLFKQLKVESQDEETEITVDIMAKEDEVDPLVQYPPEHKWVGSGKFLDIYMHVDGTIHIEVEVRDNESSD